ncbi:MAG: queuosine precursor transporter [Sandaracinaceae bacterium]|nr:queuosine precursor transporter [Sandaracinaceae bacterium]
MTEEKYDFPLPQEQDDFEGLPRLGPHELHLRRERVFIVLAGFFIGTLAMLNILGITRFLDASFTVFGLKVPMPLAVGVLPYPLTFLCTDILSEFYGRRRASFVVTVGLLINVWVVFILWLGGELPAWGLEKPNAVFFQVRDLAFGAVTASMVAYLAAQYVDVQLFHFWMKKTKGRHLWLRNNGSTLASQLVDAIAVTLVTHFLSHALPVDDHRSLWPQLFTFIAASYTFKMVTALADTGPFYLFVYYLRRYLRLNTGPKTGQDPAAAVRTGPAP